MADLSSLYPQPPQQQQTNLLANPAQTINMLQGLTTLQRQQLELQGTRALGQLYQQHVTPDGVDVPGLLQDAAKNPAAAFVLPEYMTGALAQKGQMISNSQQALSLNNSYQQAAGQFLNALGPNPTSEQVNSAMATLKRLRPDIPGALVAGWGHTILDDSEGTAHGAGVLQNYLLSPETRASRVPFISPQTGAAGTAPLSAVNVGGGALPTGLPPGSSESAQAMQADLARAHNYAADIYPWTQALSKMEELQGQGETFGPGSKGRQELESFAYTFAPTIARWAGVNPDKIQGYAEVEKYLTQGLQQRAAGFGAHTDMQVATAASGSPNVHVTDLAGIPLIKATIALKRMETAQALINSRGGGPGYLNNAAQWSSSQDPRAYMLDLMPPEQVKQLQTTLKGAERAKFNASLRDAIQSGVVTPPGQ